MFLKLLKPVTVKFFSEPEISAAFTKEEYNFEISCPFKLGHGSSTLTSHMDVSKVFYIHQNCSAVCKIASLLTS